jgi:GntR family transcriptional regulator of vanillate catabolism
MPKPSPLDRWEERLVGAPSLPLDAIASSPLAAPPPPRATLGLRPNRADVATQAARAFSGLRDLLLRGEFGRGERLSELPLVARLGMSRTPIRLALERLAHVGLLQASATGGFTVREFTPADVRDAMELRGVLEGTAARLAAERLADAGEAEPLRRCCAQMDGLTRLTGDSVARYMDLDEAFHAAVLTLAKSAMLQRSVTQAKVLPFASPSAMVFPTSVLPKSDQTLAIAQEQHRAIVDAIEQRQGTRAEAVAREHALLARRVLDVALSNQDALRALPGGPLINLAVQ